MEVMMKRHVAVVLVLAVLMYPALARAETRPGIVAAEGGGAVIGAALAGGVLGTGLALALQGNSGMWEFDAFGGALGAAIGLGLGYPAGSAAGAALVGHLTNQHGRFWPSYLGALVGTPLGALMVYKGADMRQSVGKVAVITLGCLLPPTGAVVGYNLSRPRESRLGDRLMIAPEFRVCRREGTGSARGRSTAAGIRVQFGF
jgi:hypothetical protein